MVRFGLLGTLVVDVDGVQVHIGSARQRVVLAVLLLEANHPVPVSRLIEALWEDDPPATAVTQVQICISALRRKFAMLASGPPLLTRPPGYQISVPEDDLDLLIFERLAAAADTNLTAGRAAEAAAGLHDALALWRGPACAGIASQIVKVAATRLGETHLAVQEKCFDLELRLGRHRELVGELAGLVAANPFRERLRAQLMLALYRSGNRAGALEVYRTGRALLREELGLDPGSELRELEQAILGAEHSLDLPAEGRHQLRFGGIGSLPLIPRQLPAPPPDFTGRESPRKQLSVLLRSPRVIAVLTGGGGFGKTSLALAAAHDAIGSYSHGQLFARLRRADGSAVQADEPLELFLRSLGVASRDVPESTPAKAAMFRSLLAERRMLMMLDDALDWDQLLWLLPGDCECAVVITTRNRSLHVPGAAKFEVGAMDDQAALDLLSAVIGPDRVAAQQPDARSLVRQCDLMPLALRIAAAKLAARPHWSIGRLAARLADHRRGLDELELSGVSIRSTIAVSWECLTTSAQRLLARLSLTELSEFAGWVAAPLLDLPLTMAEDVLEELVAAHLVEFKWHPDATIRYQLYELVRLFAGEQLARQPLAEREAALERYLSCLLSLARDGRRTEHFGPLTLMKSLDPPPPSCDLAAQLPADQREWLIPGHDTVVSGTFTAARAGFSRLACGLALSSAVVLDGMSSTRDWRETHEAALDAASKASDPRGEAVMHLSLAVLALTANLGEAHDHLQAATAGFDRILDDHGRAWVLHCLGTASSLEGRCEVALQRYDEALATFARIGNKRAVAETLRGAAHIRMDKGEFDSAERLLAQALDIAGTLSASRPSALVHYSLAELYLRTGRLELARTTFVSVLSVCQEIGDIAGQAYALLGCALTGMQAADPRWAATSLNEAAAAAAETGDVLLRGRVQLASAELAIGRGRTADALVRLAEAQATFREVGSVVVWQARVLELTGRVYQRCGRRSEAARAWRAALALASGADNGLTSRLVAAVAEAESG